MYLIGEAEMNCCSIRVCTVLLVIFGFLDDISMWAVSNVCKRWRHLLMSHVPDEEWHRFTEKRFPLFRALYRVHCWSYIYAKL